LQASGSHAVPKSLAGKNAHAGCTYEITPPAARSVIDDTPLAVLIQKTRLVCEWP
jgi:hypothetical protein